jgi:hypothetical protein
MTHELRHKHTGLPCGNSVEWGWAYVLGALLGIGALVWVLSRSK